jgi:flagellar hook assembly protein FlgD
MNTLSEIQKLNANMKALSKAQAVAEGAALLGKHVQALSDGRAVQGVVDQLRVNGDDVLVVVGSSTAKLADVQSVQEVK